jgi:hypothetical protein
MAELLCANGHHVADEYALTCPTCRADVRTRTAPVDRPARYEVDPGLLLLTGFALTACALVLAFNGVAHGVVMGLVTAVLGLFGATLWLVGGVATGVGMARARE